MLQYFWGWLRGYVIITVFGPNKEQFLNLALQQELDLYDVEWREGGDPVLIAKVNQRHIGALRKIARRTHCRFRLGRKQGWPFFWRHLRKRKMLLSGFLLFCLGLYVLSGFVWFVRVTPQEKIQALDQQEVLEQAQEYGIRRGAWGRGLDFDTIEKELLRDIRELSWVSIQRQGILIRIHVAERDLWTEAEENATRGAILANRAALIEEVLIKHGTPQVQAGQLVQKGDTLVAPLADGKADAIIRGRVWYEGYGECALEQTRQKPDGDSYLQLYLLRPNAPGVEESRLKLWGKKAAAGETTVSSRLVQPRLWGDRTLPLTFLIETITPLKTETIRYSEKEAKAKALAAARASLRQQIGEENQLIEETLDYHLKNGICTMTVKWECREEIGTRATEEETQTPIGEETKTDES